MRVAIVCDYLGGIGGAERVCEYICREFSEADVYTLGFNPEAVFPYFRDRSVRTTWLSRFIQTPQRFRVSFPIATYVMERLDLSAYDVVVSVSATVAKYVRARGGRHICYCFFPTRAIWHNEQYFARSLVGRVFRMILPLLKRRDFKAAQRVDQFVAISQVTQSAIEQFYLRKSVILHSPIDTKGCFVSGSRGNHYLIVSRLERWKVLDYAIEAFNQSGLPLRVIGTGEEESRLRKVSKSNITFLGQVDDAILRREYAEAKAVIFTPCLEYGLIPLEANASGTPVICFGNGGVRETMVSTDGSGCAGESPTAIFFYEQNPQALNDAIERFKTVSFDINRLVKHAQRWSVESFQKALRKQVLDAGG